MILAECSYHTNAGDEEHPDQTIWVGTLTLVKAPGLGYLVRALPAEAPIPMMRRIWLPSKGMAQALYQGIQDLIAANMPRTVVRVEGHIPLDAAQIASLSLNSEADALGAAPPAPEVADPAAVDQAGAESQAPGSISPVELTKSPLDQLQPAVQTSPGPGSAPEATPPGAVSVAVGEAEAPVLQKAIDEALEILSNPRTPSDAVYRAKRLLSEHASKK